MAGSTWPPDEQLLLALINANPDVKFILAPHEVDPARIERMIAQIDRPCLRYTQLTPQSDLAGGGVLFIDTIGILSSVYRYGKWGYIGGGFGVGIHNTLEAATFGLPLAFGPNYEKFQEARDLIGVGGCPQYFRLRAIGRLVRYFARRCGGISEEQQCLRRVCPFAQGGDRANYCRNPGMTVGSASCDDRRWSLKWGGRFSGIEISGRTAVKS